MHKMLTQRQSTRQPSCLAIRKWKRYTFAILLMGMGIMGLLYVAVAAAFLYMDLLDGFARLDWIADNSLLFLAVGGLSTLANTKACEIVRSEKFQDLRIDPTVSPRESLLRSSEIPPTLQQAELLRSTQDESATIVRQLLQPTVHTDEPNQTQESMPR